MRTNEHCASMAGARAIALGLGHPSNNAALLPDLRLPATQRHRRGGLTVHLRQRGFLWLACVARRRQARARRPDS